jgi:hypothetical protein
MQLTATDTFFNCSNRVTCRPMRCPPGHAHDVDRSHCFLVLHASPLFPSVCALLTRSRFIIIPDKSAVNGAVLLVSPANLIPSDAFVHSCDCRNVVTMSGVESTAQTEYPSAWSLTMSNGF